jgi:hypothetical protein
MVSSMPITIRCRVRQQAAGRRKCCADTGGVSEIDLGEEGELAFYDLERHALHRRGGVAGQALPL